MTKTNDVFVRKTSKFGQESLQNSEKENSDNLDQFLNIDNLPEGGLQVKFVLKSNSENVLVSFTEAFTEGSGHVRLRPGRELQSNVLKFQNLEARNLNML